MLAGILERGFVGDAEADEARVAQLHGLNALKIGFLLAGRLGIGAARGAGTRDEVKERIRQLVDAADALGSGLGRDEEDGAQIVALKNFLVLLQVVVQGQVRQDEPIDAHGRGFAAEVLHAELHHRVEVAHEQDGRVGHSLADVFKLAEQHGQAHAVFEGGGAAELNHGSVGERVGEGHSDFDKVGTGLC